MIPVVFERYLEDNRRAAALAGSGHLAAGFTCLMAGLRAAEAAVKAGQRWAPALRRCYQEALDEYQARYGVRTG